MITEKRAEEKLENLAKMFNLYIQDKRWQEAKAAYDSALNVATFLELQEARIIYYFGSREPEYIKGLFQEEKVQKVYEECIFKERRQRETEEKRRRKRRRF